VLSKSQAALDAMRDKATHRYDFDPGNVRAWTDDYSDILSALKFRWR